MRKNGGSSSGIRSRIPSLIKKSLKINEAKISYLSNNQLNYDAQVLSLQGNLEEFQSFFENELPPNVFVVEIKILKIDKIEIEKILMNLCKNIPQNHQLFVLIIDSEVFHAFEKPKNGLDFIKIEIKTENNNWKLKNAEDFLTILTSLKVSFTNVDFNQILAFKKLSTENSFSSLLKNAIETKNESFLKLLLLFTTKLPDYLLTEALKPNNFNILLVILNSFTPSEIDDDLIKTILKNNQIETIFLTITQQNKFNALKILIKNPNNFAKHVNYSTWVNARKIALANNFHDFLSQLQRVEKEFYPDLKSKKIPQFITTFHQSIENGNFPEIKTFVTKFPHFKICHDQNEICALEKSIDKEKFAIYSYLKSESFLPHNEQRLKEKIENLTIEQKRIIRDENLIHAKPNPDNFISILATKCDLQSHANHLSFTNIHEMLEVLGKTDDIQWIMRNAADTDIKIDFDFQTKSVQSADPTRSENVLGIAYYEKSLLYVGRNGSQRQRYGTFAHELTHFMMFKIYENRCLPYCKNDKKREKKWKEVVEGTRKIYEGNQEATDDIIKWVFRCYKDGYEQSTELAVRVPEIMAYYHDKPEKREELGIMFKLVFTFMRNYFFKDLKIPNIMKIINFNNSLEVLKNIENSHFQVEMNESEKIFKILNLPTQENSKILLISKIPQLTLSKIIKEIDQFSRNKLSLKAKNLFINQKVGDHTFLKKELEKLAATPIQRLVIDTRGSQVSKFKFLKTFELNFSCFAVVDETEKSLIDFFTKKLNFKVHEDLNGWQDLSKDTIEYIKNRKVLFQGNPSELKVVFPGNHDLINEDILKVFCSSQKIEINCENSVRMIKTFIPRYIRVKKSDSEYETSKSRSFRPSTTAFLVESSPSGSLKYSNSFPRRKNIGKIMKNDYKDVSLDTFIDGIMKPDKFFNIVLISDVAGSGKTTLLEKIYSIYKDTFNTRFVSFVTLKNHIKELSEGVGDSFVSFLIKIMKFDELTEAVFKKKYLRGETTILFDAFDEISPICKEKTIKLFKLLKTQSHNQIIITTRSHLEHDLEKELNISACKLKILDKIQQVEFIKSFWRNPDLDEELVENCANLLIEYSNKIVMKSKVIGLPLIVQHLAEIYKDKIDENFEQKIKKLDITTIFRKIIYLSLNVFSTRHTLESGENLRNFSSPIQIHQFLAIVSFFDEQFATNLGLIFNKTEWSLERIARCGIIKYDKNFNIQFNHDTCAEFLIAFLLFNFIQNVKKFNEFHFDFFIQILILKKFQITRMFLEGLIEDGNVTEIGCDFSECNKVEILFLCVCENLCKTFQLIVKELKEQNPDFLEKCLRVKGNRGDNLLGLAAVVHIKIEFFELIWQTFEENLTPEVIVEILNEKNQFEEKTFELVCRYSKSVEILSLFWSKVQKFINGQDLVDYLLKNHLNPLFYTIIKKNEIFFSFLLQNVFNTEILIQEKHLTYGENFLHFLAQFGTKTMIESAFEQLKLVFSTAQSLLNFIKTPTNFESNIFHCAADINKCSEAVKCLLNQVEIICGREELKIMLSDKRSKGFKYFPLQGIITSNKPSIFVAFFSVYREIFSVDEIHELLQARNGDGKNVYEIARDHEDKNFFVIVLRELNYYLPKYFYNKLATLIKTQKSSELVEALLTEMDNKINFQEILTFKDENNQNIFHLAALYLNSEETLKILWIKIKNSIFDQNLKEFLLVKGFEGRNILYAPIQYGNHAVFCYLLNIFCEKLELSAIINDTDDVLGENLFQFLARFGSVTMIEFTLRTLVCTPSHNDAVLNDAIKFKSKFGRNILHCAAESNTRVNSIKMFLEYIDKADVLKMMSECDKWKKIPLQCAIRCNNLPIFNFFYSFYCEKFTENELKMIFHDDNKKLINSLIDLAGNYVDKKMIDDVVDAIKSLIEKKDNLQ